MSTSVLLTQKEDGSDTVTLVGNVIYDTTWWPVRVGHQVLSLADGTEYVQDDGPTKIYGVLAMKNISYANGVEFRDWLSGSIVFSKNQFDMGPIPNTDLGNGKNTAIGIAGGNTTNLRFNGGHSLEGILTYTAPGIFSVKLPFMYIE